MEFLTIAFGVVGGSLALYVGWLGVHQRHLARQLHELESQLDATTETNHSHSQQTRRAA
ncbi:MAG: hypothetical protein KDA42_00025 [Planctomycetales bacterium]|nr:hypothetical protein [Planctomycetales bacterium]